MDLCKKEIIKNFNEVLGFPIGSKTYSVRIPKIIMNSENPAIWSAFVRGFSDCDGNLNFDKRYGKNYQEIPNKKRNEKNAFVIEGFE